MKTIALFGGSFNPPHDGHFEMAKFIYESLKADEIWLLFSVNHLKDPAKYAPLEHRLAMGEIMKKHFTDTPIVLSDIEEQLGTHITYDVLSKLKVKFPNHRFVWVMGADNLATFHKWENWDKIMEEFPVVVIDRPPYGDSAEKSEAALTYAYLRQNDAATVTSSGHGWSYLKGPLYNISSTHLLEEMHAGRTQFDGTFQDVADYIREKGLYGINAVPVAAPALQAALPSGP